MLIAILRTIPGSLLRQFLSLLSCTLEVVAQTPGEFGVGIIGGTYALLEHSVAESCEQEMPQDGVAGVLPCGQYDILGRHGGSGGFISVKM
jgi:hypothetical protein